MLRHLILRKLAAEERRLGAPLDYLRHILDASLRSFLVFAKILPISTHRKALPVKRALGYARSCSRVEVSL